MVTSFPVSTMTIVLRLAEMLGRLYYCLPVLRGAFDGIDADLSEKDAGILMLIATLETTAEKCLQRNLVLAFDRWWPGGDHSFERSAATVAITLRKLRSAKLVEHDRDTSDRRLKRISLTAAGHACVQRIHETRSIHLRQMQLSEDLMLDLLRLGEQLDRQLWAPR